MFDSDFLALNPQPWTLDPFGLATIQVFSYLWFNDSQEGANRRTDEDQWARSIVVQLPGPAFLGYGPADVCGVSSDRLGLVRLDRLDPATVVGLVA